MRRTGLQVAWATVCLAASSGCASNKLLHLENELLKKRAEALEAELAERPAQTASADFAPAVDIGTIQTFLRRSGYTHATPAGDAILTLPVDGRNTSFQVSLQLFDREKVLYLAVHDYLSLEDAASSQSMVLLLTQLVTMNYELLLGKFQLNPRTGDISLSVEIQVDDGLGHATFDSVLNHLIFTADQRHPELLQAARGRGI